MPFGFFEKRDDAESKRLQDEAVAALNSGGITPQAAARLKKVRDEGGIFNAGLSPAGMLSGRRAGFTPITQVMGSCFVWLQYFDDEERERSQDLNSVTSTYANGRAAALNRLMLEAQLVGADGVIEVKIESRRFGFNKCFLEFCATGTAIRCNFKPPSMKEAVAESASPLVPEGGGAINQLSAGFLKRKGTALEKTGRTGPIIARAGEAMRVGAASVDKHLQNSGADKGRMPFLALLSADEFSRLTKAGYWPTTIVCGNFTSFTIGDAQTKKAQMGILASAQNQELSAFADGLARCRHQAQNRFKREIKVSGSEGVVGVEIESEIEPETYKGAPGIVQGMIVHFCFMGTGVKKLAESACADNSAMISTLPVIDLARVKTRYNFDSVASGRK